jgi:hypothetical protein
MTTVFYAMIVSGGLLFVALLIFAVLIVAREKF